MFPYFFTFICSNSCAVAYSKTKTQSGRFCALVLLFFFLFIPSAIRYGVGCDYFEYQKMVDTAILTNKYMDFERGEPGWVAILYIMDIFNLNTQWFFIITSFFSIAIICSVFGKKDAWIGILGYTLLVYNISYNIVRQTFAITIFLLGVKKFINKKIIVGFFWAFIACLFHKALYVMLLLFPFILITKTKYNKIYNLWILGIIALLVFKFNVATLIMETIIPNTGFAHYIVGAMNDKTGGTGLGILLKMIICSSPLIFFRYNKKSSAKINREHAIICACSFFQIITYILSRQIIAMHRLPTLFLTCQIYMLHDIYYIKSKYRKIVFYSVISLLIMFFIFEVMNSPSGANGGQGLTPYRTIFEK